MAVPNMDLAIWHICFIEIVVKGRNEMMNLAKRSVVVLALSLITAPAWSVTLFGQDIAKVDRTTMRAALKSEQVGVKREDNGYWVDLYNAAGLLDEAKQLAIGYRDSDSRLATLTYTFDSFMDTQQVARIANLVSQAYGKPDSRSGDPSLGGVSYRWHRDGLSIEVSRGWPSTTTTLMYTNEPIYKAMKAEIAREKERQAKERASQQQGRF
jgi:hypothetical protein